MADKAKIDSLIKELQAVASHSEQARGDVMDAARDLRRSISTRNDIYNRFEQMNLELSVSRIAQDLKIYQILSESSSSLEVNKLAAKVGAAPLLTRRILRFLASVGQIDETGPDTYAANLETRVLAEPGYRGLIYHAFDNIAPVLQGFPDFLRGTNYRDIADAAATPAQKVFQTPLPMFAWLPSQPARFEPLQQTMSVQPRGEATWFAAFPFAEQLGSFDFPDVLVDVGGGFGHQCLQLLGAYPQLKGKLVLQELEQTLAHVPALDGVRTMAYDFFTEQPVKGARFYYLRHILHDWPEDKALAILARVKAAMGPGSQLLIDEIVMPNEGAHEQATTIDMIMMSSLGSIERTVDDWHDLLGKAGFKVGRIDTYFERRQNSIIQAVPV